MFKAFFKDKKYLFLFLIIFGLIIGTFFDFKVSSILYHKNNIFGLFFAAYGQLPFNLGFAISGTLMFLISLKTNKQSWIVYGILLNLLSLILCTISPLLYLKNLSWILALIISLILIIISNCLIYRYLKDVEVDNFVEYLYEKLLEYGYEADKNVGKNVGIDIAIFDAEKGAVDFPQYIKDAIKK